LSAAGSALMRVVVFGQSGQVAKSLAAIRSDLDFRFFGRSRIDPSAPEIVRDIIAAERPELVLNAAAYTLVDLAEKERDFAFALNEKLPYEIAIACSRLRVPFVHISTDYVFDGEKKGAYLETDAPNPISVYGASKLAGDIAIAGAADVPHAILRASWVFSHVGETFPRKIIRRAKEAHALRVVNDQIGCPTSSDDLAAAMIAIGRKLLDDDAKAVGLFNYCGDKAMTWFDFAARLIEVAKPLGLGDCAIAAMGTEELHLAAKRPKNSVLDCRLIGDRCGISPAPVMAAIDRAAERLMAEASSGA
jgi:dTDP-4-dehydrorhamnose reductase